MALTHWRVRLVVNRSTLPSPYLLTLPALSVESVHSGNDKHDCADRLYAITCQSGRGGGHVGRLHALFTADITGQGGAKNRRKKENQLSDAL